MAARSDASDDGNYAVPETFLNLDEVVAPPPVTANPRRHGVVFRDSSDHSDDDRSARASEEEGHGQDQSLETSLGAEKEQGRSRQQPESWGNFTHIVDRVAPAAARSSVTHPSQTLEGRLEDAGDRATTGANSSIWQSANRKRASQLATTAYTVCYLVLFSILGTLARLGLQALTSYPGAPVTTPVVWANFAGSFVMGFLSEDRQLFKEEWGEQERRRKFSTKRERRAVQRQDRELVKRAQRYSRTALAPTPFTNPNTAQLYPVKRVLSQRRPFSMPSVPGQSEPSIISESTAPQMGDPEEERTRHSAIKKTIPLYIGLATGFCGSLTSFSSFMRDAFLALAGSTPSASSALNNFSTIAEPHAGGYSFLSLLAVLIYEPAVSLAALYAGAHLALALDPWMPSFSFSATRKFIDRAAAVLAVGFWVGAIMLVALPPDRPGGPAAASDATWASESWRSVTFAVALAPLGCLLRFYVSLMLNSVLPSFPLGTFVVNIGGSLLEAAFYDVQHARLPMSGGVSVGGGRVGCQALQGAMDGFCGCLTTVSTWVAELNGLRRRHAWLYGAVSIAAGVAAMVVVMGPLRWTVGFAPSACGM